MAISGTGAIITESQAFYLGHVYLSQGSTKALTYGKMVDNANAYNADGTTNMRHFAGSWLTDAMRSQSNVTPPAINRYKCVKYADIKTKIVRVPWTFTISEDVYGATRARTIEVRFYYTETSGGEEKYKVMGSYTWDNNISGSGTTTHYIEVNPYALLNQDVHSSNVKIWCGTTNTSQTWKWRMRNKGTSGPLSGTWGSWSSTSSGKTCLANPLYGGYTSNYAPVGLADKYNGIEFYVS